MIEVEHNIFIGCDADVSEFEANHAEGAIIHAAKEPYHRQALGYGGRAAPKDSDEYLVAFRDDPYRLCLNLVDSPKPEFIPEECFGAAVQFINTIREEEGADYPILINCNQGKSRSVGIYLYFLVKGEDGPNTLVEAIEYLESLGMDVAMGDGVSGALANWLD